MKILFLSSEIAPFAKTGGLADVSSSLPKALAEKGETVKAVMPLYSSIDRDKHKIEPFMESACVHMGNCEEWYSVHKTEADGVEFYFIEFSKYFNRPGIYHTPAGEYPDNAYRFAFFTRAALQLSRDLNFIPDIVHANDWQTALAPYYVRFDDAFSFDGAGSVLTIHNIGYQGKFGADVMEYAAIKPEHFYHEYFEDFGGLNFLKGGLASAGKITTVSPTYAREIQGPIGGSGLHLLLEYRRYDLHGILNGIDTDVWNPAKDTYIPKNYSAETIDDKIHSKRELQKRFHLEEKDNTALFGFVGRFAAQKGLDLLGGAIEDVLRDMEVQFVVVGSGDSEMERHFGSLSENHPWRAGSYIGYSEELAHLVEAGADFFVMPSHYEPCGLNQMYSLNYGTIPVVRNTGGLADTVVNYNETDGSGTGFKFNNIDTRALYDTIGWAVSTYYDRPDHIKKMQIAGMEQDFSWDRSAEEYLRLYRMLS
ncbi:glycogen synthase GlgA [Limisalsivibrio acetivorans]|uniref:glycogen synthase GlgA n=1 Tax=Limisalsivibrio acetivorans TaxID=1304888 RepID=UPI0003B39B94|nr:glycogen synthase GlgA [Limisalsivibrio acetivorans]